MIAVYPLGYYSVWDNNELRYSMRSLKHIPEVTDVLLVGQQPEWADTKHIYTYDGANRVHNIWRKMEAISEYMEGSNNAFLFMADDIFITRPTSIPMYYDGDIQKKIGGAEHIPASGRYRDMLIATKMLLEYHTLPTINFALHYPLIVYPDILKKSLEFKGDYSWRTIYCNLSYHYHRQEIHEHIDCKLWKPEEYNNHDIFSISDRFLTKQGRELIQTLFPDKSIFEKD